MRKYFYLVYFFLLVLQFYSYAQQHIDTSNKVSQKPLSSEQKMFGLITIWSEVKFGFPYPGKLQALKWDELVQSYIPRVENANSLEEYYKVLMEYVTLLDDDHTSVLPPWGYFKEGYDFPPIEIKVIHDKFYISRVGQNEEIISQQIRSGAEILEVDNIPVKSFFREKILKYYSKGSKQANEAILVLYILYGPANEKVRIKIKDLNETERDIRLTRNSVCRDGSPFMYPFIYNTFVASTIEVNRIADNILYINLPNFEHEQMAEDFQKLIDTLDASEVKGMILDVRQNMGGSSQICNKIVQCLIKEPVSSPLMHYPHYVAAHKAWGRDVLWDVNKNIIDPRVGRRYSGSVFVLIGPVTASSAEDFAIELKTANRATIVGQSSAGSAGNSLRFDLPGGGTFSMATFKATYPDGRNYVGIGIKPDIEVLPNLNDLIEEKDRALEKCIKLLIMKK